jgi:ElaB/YqjD/DUF883 family membrane-anchored ribosome-binding protein
MNATFRALSDLVADAEDLVARVSESGAPEVRALADAVEDSVSSMKSHLRDQVRRLAAQRDGRRLAGFALDRRWIALALAGAITAGVLVSLRTSRRSRRLQA